MTNETYKFDCGCEFPVLKNEDGSFRGLDYSPDKVPLNCPDVWAMVCEGKTLGGFQVTSQLGRSLCSKAKPSSIEELSDVIAIQRPGCLDAFIDGKNITNHYIDRKHKKEEARPLHAALAEITRDTQYLILYQETVLKAAQILAGFSPVESRNLQKAMGKKKPELMAKAKQDFADGCAKIGTLSKEEAESVFEIIEANQRYSFNKCLSPNTIVEMENGVFTTLEDIQIGDKILDHHNEYSTVIDKIESGEHELYEFETCTGEIIQCTLSHKFLCEDGKIREIREIVEYGHAIMAFC